MVLEIASHHDIYVTYFWVLCMQFGKENEQKKPTPFETLAISLQMTFLWA